MKKLAALFLAFGFIVASMVPAFARHGDGRRDWDGDWNRRSFQRSWGNNNDWNRRRHFNRRSFNNNNGYWRSQRKWNNGKHKGWYKNGKAYRNYRGWW
jgi:hypothetical protein